MKHVSWMLLMVVSISLLPACQRKPLSQIHVMQVWEYGKPIHVSYGYTKGVWTQQFKQYVFFDQGIYHCRSTTLVSQGFSQDQTTNQIKGKWKSDGNGVPRLEQPDGSYLAITTIHPAVNQQIPGPTVSHLQQAYKAPQSKPFAVPDPQEMINPLEKPEQPTKPEATPPNRTDSLPIVPYRP